MFMYMVCKIFAIIFVQNDEVLKKQLLGNKTMRRTAESPCITPIKKEPQDRKRSCGSHC